MATCHLAPFSPFITLTRKQPAFSTRLNLFSRLSLSSSRFFNISASASPSPSSMASDAKKVLVPIANGTEPLEAVITIDILRRAGADVTVASVDKELHVDACHGVKIVADSLINDCAQTLFDLISLPGGMPGAATLKDCSVLKDMVEKQATDGRLHAAICAAPAVALGSWGLLKGLKATCYPSFMEQLSSSATAVESRVQQDGKVVTSRGPGTAMEYSVALVEQLYGIQKADEVAGPLLMRSNHGDEYLVRELNPMQWTFTDCPQILVPIADGTEEMEAVIIIDVLRRAQAKVTVATVGEKLEILASRNVKLVGDMHLDEAVKFSYDLIVLPGGLGGAQAFAASEKLVEMLKKQRESNRPYGAICASPALVLESHGLLKIWAKVFGIFGEDWICPSSLVVHFQGIYRGCGKKKEERLLWRIVQHAMIWCIWLERNNHIFESKYLPIGLVWDKIVHLASLWAFAYKLFPGVPLVDIDRDWRMLVH